MFFHVFGGCPEPTDFFFSISSSVAVMYFCINEPGFRTDHVHCCDPYCTSSGLPYFSEDHTDNIYSISDGVEFISATLPIIHTWHIIPSVFSHRGIRD